MLVKTDYSGEGQGRAKTLTLWLKVRAMNSSQENPADRAACKGEISKDRSN